MQHDTTTADRATNGALLNEYTCQRTTWALDIAAAKARSDPVLLNFTPLLVDHCIAVTHSWYRIM